MICYIVGAGDLDPKDLAFSPKKEDLVIAADAGFRLAEKAGLRIDLFIGDGDSLGAFPNTCPKIVLPVVKDDTDTVAAVKEGFNRGYSRFVLLGCLGGKRVSHSLANVQTLAYIQSRGGEGMLKRGNTTLWFLPQKTEISATLRGSLSLFAYGGTAEVSLDGLKYSISHHTLTPDFPLGVSNSFVGTPSTVTLHSGRVLAVLEEAEK